MNRANLLLFALYASLASVGLFSPGAAQNRKTPTMEDAKAYREAMVWFKKAEALIGTPQENSEQQAELFRKALQIKPDFLEAHFNLGLIYANQKKNSEAIREFEAVLKLEPKFEQGIHLMLASAYREVGNTDGAMAALEQGLKNKPDDLQLLKPLAYLQFNSGRESAAIQTLQRILELNPTDVNSRMDLALLYQKTDRFDDAAENYRDALSIEPNNFAAHYNLGLIYLRQKKHIQAAGELEFANRTSPGKADVLERLGDAYGFANQFEKAAAAYQSALGSAGGNPAQLLSKLGFSLASSNRMAEAIAALEKSLALEQKNPDAYYLLGDLYSESKRYDESIAAYRAALNLQPNRKEVHFNLGTVLAERQQFQDALVELRAAVQLDPNYAPGWGNLALVAEKVGMDQDAIQAHEKVIALGNAQPQNYFRLGVLYAKANQVEPAVSNLAKAIELEPDKYRQILREELKKVHSVLDSIRYTERFTRLLTGPPPTPVPNHE